VSWSAPSVPGGSSRPPPRVDLVESQRRVARDRRGAPHATPRPASARASEAQETTPSPGGRQSFPLFASQHHLHLHSSNPNMSGGAAEYIPQAAMMRLVMLSSEPAGRRTRSSPACLLPAASTRSTRSTSTCTGCIAMLSVSRSEMPCGWLMKWFLTFAVIRLQTAHAPCPRTTSAAAHPPTASGSVSG
jgi:hypothetical protein